jgi:outer membrane lipoprotein SlyB
MKHIFTLSIFAIFTFLFASCTPQELTGDTYSRGEVGQAQTVQRGHIEDIRYVKIQGGSTAGTVIGGIAGGLLGREVGSGSGKTLATLGGAGLGAVAGSAAEQKLQNRQGVELTVHLDNGEKISITQEVNPRESFSIGDQVRVMYGSGRARVTR